MTNNIGMRFENWAASNENYQKMLAKKPVEQFNFVEKTDFSKTAPENKAKVYTEAVQNIASSRISNYDANKNQKMEFDEYVTEQSNVYKKTFNEEIDLSIPGMMKMLRGIFNNSDLNRDGSIDNKEMSAVFAYMDKADNKEGLIDGKIAYESAIGTNWGHPDMPEVLQMLKDFLFPPKN